MQHYTPKRALVVGAGAGLSAAVARLLVKDGVEVSLAARTPDDLSDLCTELSAKAYACDASKKDDVAALFSALDADGRTPDFVLYNPSARAQGPFIELDPDEVYNAIMVTAYGGFLVALEAARRMVEKGEGAIFFTGASASVKGYAQSASFAMGKFSLRGLAQSMARELQPQNIHVAHFVIDGGIRSETRHERMGNPDAPDAMLEPEAIAETYMSVLRQHRSAWSWEVELRPWVERF